MRDGLLAALEANAATGDPLPLQVHCGFGDADLALPLARPGLLKPLIERFDTTPFVLLHCYPFVREAGWLAHVYGNVYFDLSLTIPHVSRPAAALAEALELAPVSKLLYASDAARAPELYLLAATWWRDALAEVLPALLSADAAAAAARMILRDNALGLYRARVAVRKTQTREAWDATSGCWSARDESIQSSRRRTDRASARRSEPGSQRWRRAGVRLQGDVLAPVDDTTTVSVRAGRGAGSTAVTADPGVPAPPSGFNLLGSAPT